jgi:hypothetical protein
VALSASDLDSFVEIDDSGMIGFGEGSKKAFDVRAVVVELFATMGKNVGDGVNCFFPGNDPFAMGIHGACRF